MNRFSTVIWLVIIALGLTLFVIGSTNNSEPSDDDNLVITSETPAPTATPELTPKPTGIVINNTPTPTPTPSNNGGGFVVPTSPPRSEITGPASCNLVGKITFLNSNTALNEAFIEYNNVDSPVRLIFWSSSPNDNVFDIGPNIFSSLKLPNGKNRVNIVVKEDAQLISSKYTLMARINYGIVDKDGAPIATMIVDCSGSIEVDLTDR